METQTIIIAAGSIILGWLFGLLSPIISARIERKYKQNDVRLAIFSELKNLAGRLTMISFKVRKHLGNLNKTSLKWIVESYEKYYPLDQKLINATKILLETPNEKFEVAMNRFKAAENISIGLKTFSLPFIDSSIENILILDSKFQQKILEIRYHVDMLNQEIETSKNYFLLTFNPESQAVNREIISKNINASYDMILVQCELLVDLIGNLIKLKTRKGH